MTEILSQIGIHCKNFVDLRLEVYAIDTTDALAIVTHMPNIESLSLVLCNIAREKLVTILKGCTRLSYFAVFECKAPRLNIELLGLASHIGTFNYLLKKLRRIGIELQMGIFIWVVRLRFGIRFEL